MQNSDGSNLVWSLEPPFRAGAFNIINKYNWWFFHLKVFDHDWFATPFVMLTCQAFAKHLLPSYVLTFFVFILYAYMPCQVCIKCTKIDTCKMANSAKEMTVNEHAVSNLIGFYQTRLSWHCWSVWIHFGLVLRSQSCFKG